MSEEAATLRAELSAAMAGPGDALSAANRLCQACVDLLGVDGAAISLVHESSSQGTFGSSGALARRLDEWQFTFGEGPCMDAVRGGAPVLAADLASPGEQRWPAFTDAVLGAGVRGVFAMPVAIASSWIGALDLFTHDGGPLDARALTGGLLAAELAAVPLLDLMTAVADRADAGHRDNGWAQLASLERVEVYQATGMVMSALDVDPAEALVRLRAHAYAYGMTASEVAWAIVERTLTLDDDGWRPPGHALGGQL